MIEILIHSCHAVDKNTAKKLVITLFVKFFYKLTTEMNAVLFQQK